MADLVLAVTTVTGLCVAHADEHVENWFDDPFFQISSAIDCPLPAGPFTTEAGRLAETHHRAERGTSCWLAGQCDRPNSYAYDQDIARAIRSALSERNPFSDTTLWITVQGRIVYVEGCANREQQARAAEEFMRAIPYVQQVIASVRTDQLVKAPDRLRY